MSEHYLMRNEAPLSDEEWERLDKVVVGVAKKQLVGRRFIGILGPLGPGIQNIHRDVFEGMGAASLDLFGEKEAEGLAVACKDLMAIPMIYKEFRLLWRDIETSRRAGVSLDLGVAAGASAFCAWKEDGLIFNGDAEVGYTGLLNAEGRTTVPKSNWGTAGNAFKNITAAVEKLTQAGCYEPYALVVSPDLYTQMQSLYGNMGRLEIELVRELASGGVYASPAISSGKGALVSTGAHQLDLVVGQDLITAYLGPERMNHTFRVLETVVLRIKRPEAICTLEQKS